MYCSFGQCLDDDIRIYDLKNISTKSSKNISKQDLAWWISWSLILDMADNDQFIFDVVDLRQPTSQIGSYKVRLSDLHHAVLFIASGDFTREICAFHDALEKKEEMQFSFYIATNKSLVELQDMSSNFQYQIPVILDSDSRLSKLFQTYDETTKTALPSWYGIDEKGYICFEVTRQPSAPPVCPNIIIHAIKEFQKIQKNKTGKELCEYVCQDF